MNKTTLVFVLAIISVIISCQQTNYPYGERIFKANCASCHMEDGLGVARLYPALKSSSIDSIHTNLPCIIRYGVSDTSSILNMDGLPHLSDVEITNVINYILTDLNAIDITVDINIIRDQFLDCKNSPNTHEQ